MQKFKDEFSYLEQAWTFAYPAVTEDSPESIENTQSIQRFAVWNREFSDSVYKTFDTMWNKGNNDAGCF